MIWLSRTFFLWSSSLKEVSPASCAVNHVPREKYKPHSLSLGFWLLPLRSYHQSSSHQFVVICVFFLDAFVTPLSLESGFFPLEQTGHGLNKVGHCCHLLKVKNYVSVFIKIKWPLLPFLFSFFYIFLYSKLSQPHICLAIYFSSL